MPEIILPNDPEAENEKYASIVDEIRGAALEELKNIHQAGQPITNETLVAINQCIIHQINEKKFFSNLDPAIINRLDSNIKEIIQMVSLQMWDAIIHDDLFPLLQKKLFDLVTSIRRPLNNAEFRKVTDDVINNYFVDLLDEFKKNETFNKEIINQIKLLFAQFGGINGTSEFREKTILALQMVFSNRNFVDQPNGGLPSSNSTNINKFSPKKENSSTFSGQPPKPPIPPEEKGPDEEPDDDERWVEDQRKKLLLAITLLESDLVFEEFYSRKGKLTREDQGLFRPMVANTFKPFMREVNVKIIGKESSLVLSKWQQEIKNRHDIFLTEWIGGDTQVKSESKEHYDVNAREAAFSRILASQKSYQTEFNAEDYHIIMDVCEQKDDLPEWTLKLNALDAWNAGLGATKGKSDLKELAFGDVDAARAAIAGEKISFSGTREFIWDSPEGKRFRESFGLLDKIFAGNINICDYSIDGKNISYPKSGYNYVANGDPTDVEKQREQRILTVNELLDALTNKNSKIKIRRLVNSKGETIESNFDLDLSASDVNLLYQLMFIYEYRSLKESSDYAQYVFSPKASFDQTPIRQAAPLSYVLYKAISGSLIRPDFYELWFSQRLPEINSQNSGNAYVGYNGTQEVIRRENNGVPTRWDNVLQDALEVREEAIDEITTIDLFKLSKYFANLPKERIFGFYKKRDENLQYNNSLKGFENQQQFTTRVNENYQTLPFMWQLFSAKKDSPLRGLSYKNIIDGYADFAKFIEAVNKFPKGKKISLNSLSTYIGSIFPNTSSLKGLETSLRGTEFYGIFIGTITVMSALYLKYLYDAYDSSTSGPVEVKQAIFRNRVIQYLSGQSATFMDIIRGRLICLMEDSVGSFKDFNKKMCYDFFSDVKPIPRVKVKGGYIPMIPRLRSLFDSRYSVFYRVPDPSELADTDGQ